MADFSYDPLLASPRQASNIFGPNGQHPIRQKHLFVVRFIRQASVSADWKDSLTFVVKSMGRPSVEASTETLNQYNRKRIVHTGVKYNNVDLTLYDTADGAAQNMWIEYAAYHFGDYNQDYGSFADDLLNDTMFDNGKGYGFRIQGDASADGIGSQHFFDALEVYQFWGNEYTSYRLVNPRIVSFTPDELDYSVSDAASISMSLAYEAVSHFNNGRSSDLLADDTLVSIFSGGPFDGRVLEFLPAQPAQTFSMPEDQQTITTAQVANFRDDTTQTVRVRTTDLETSGALARYGNYYFGTSPASDSIAYSAANAAFIDGAIPSVLSSGINRAAIDTNSAVRDQITTENGFSLSGEAYGAANQVSDGTVYYGSNDLESR